MWLWSWLDSLLNYLGLAQRSGRLVFLGLDNAGKTTLLQMLSHGRVSASLPTGRPTEERLALGGLRLTAFDLGGHLQARRVWKDYFPAVDGLVFVVDAAHPQRFEEARHELQGLLAEQQVAGIPLMVLGNKIDKPSAVGEAELRRALSLRGTTSGKGKVAACLSSPPLLRGRRWLTRGARRCAAAGALHGQRAEGPGLRRGLPLARPAPTLIASSFVVFTLTLPSFASTAITHSSLLQLAKAAKQGISQGPEGKA